MLRRYRRSPTITERGVPVKHDTILYRTHVLLCVFRAIYTGPIHINHALYRATPYNVPTDTNYSIQQANTNLQGGRGISY